MKYSDLLLAFKLLTDSCLGPEAQDAVFEALQSCENDFTEGFLLQTVACLSRILCDKSDELEIKEERYEVSLCKYHLT